ncbi:T9SS type A sorting domain-containing protein [bacterium]|nr:T9SS type A sorting domain-containing protein [bacterium]
MNTLRQLLLVLSLVMIAVSCGIASELINPVTDHGVYGRYDSDLVSGEFPANSGKYYLWEGRLWVGAVTNSTRYVTAAGPDTYEWTPDGGGTPVVTAIGGETLEWTAQFNDNGAVGGHTPLGLEVTQTVEAWSWIDQPHNAHQIQITLSNTSGAALDSVYVGWVFDFDVCYGPNGDDSQASQDDRAGWDADRWLGYMWDGDNPDEPGDDTGDNGISPGYIGVTCLDADIPPSAFQAWTSGNDPATDSDKFGYLAGIPNDGGGAFDDPPATPGDYRVMLSVGPYSMADGASETVVVALCVGDGLDGLETATDEMIAWYNRPVQFEMTPEQTIIPPEGGDLVYGASLMSTLPNTVPGLSFWTDIEFPNGQLFSPVQRIPFTHTPFMQANMTGITQTIPELAPEGEYTYFGYVGFYPNAQLSDFITFTKTGGTAGDAALTPETWPSNIAQRIGETVIASEDVTGPVAAQPSEFQLSAAHPNPFNAATSLTVNLPSSGQLRVELINLTGQRVMVLSDGIRTAGTHQFSINAETLASGLYFVRASVPGHMDQVRKVMLLR